MAKATTTDTTANPEPKATENPTQEKVASPGPAEERDAPEGQEAELDHGQDVPEGEEVELVAETLTVSLVSGTEVVLDMSGVDRVEFGFGEVEAEPEPEADAGEPE